MQINIELTSKVLYQTDAETLHGFHKFIQNFVFLSKPSGSF